MKIKKVKIKKYPLFKLYLLKYNKSNMFFNNKHFSELFYTLEVELKYLLRLIFEYHISNKKILFIGLNNKFTILKHNIFLPKALLGNDLLSSKTYSINLANNPPKLIVIFNSVSSDFNFIKSVVRLNIPIILFGYDYYISKKLNNKSKIFKFGLNLSEEHSYFYQFLTNCIIKNKN